MGNDVLEVVEGQPSVRTVKVHARMCSELLILITRISKIFPEIERARPRCSSGIEALCLLNNGIVKAKSLFQHCSESSALYLALTGDAILSRCKKSRNLLEHSLNQIQTMVPVNLADQISEVIADLRSTTFCLDPSEEEAGKVLKDLLHRYGAAGDSAEEAALADIQSVSSWLHISSQKALVIEKRSIKKLLEKIGESEPNKRKILLFFLYLLNKYAKIISKDQKDNGSSEFEDRFPRAGPYHLSAEMEPCMNYGTNDPQFDMLHVSIPNPKVHQRLAKTWENSTNSIASLTSSMNDLNLPLDFSNMSLGSSNDVKLSNEIDMDFLSNFHTLAWDSRCDAVETVKRLLNRSDESWSVIPLGKFVPSLLGFLKDAHDLRDVEPLITGCQLLLELVHQFRDSISYMKEDAYDLLASFLDTEAAKYALSVLESLSSHQQCLHNIVASSALIGILNILESQVEELLEPALKILTNLSSNRGTGSLIICSDFIPKLIPLFEDNNLARYCVTILKNFCDVEDAKRVSIFAETDGCIASIVKILENDSHEDQEHAVSVLLSLCSERVEYCKLVMDEGVIPGLVSISINGNKRAKVMAMELLRILKDETNTTGESSTAAVSVEPTDQRKDNDPPKARGLFDKIFSKRSTLAAKKKT